jgi:WD40 repeat protein
MNIRRWLFLACVCLGLAFTLPLTMRSLDTPVEVATFEGHSAFVLGVVASSDGKILVSWSRDKTVKLWDVASRKQLATLSGHTDAIRAVAFSPDASILATVGDKDRTIKVWDVASGEEQVTLQGHTAEVRSVAFGPDGHTLASGGDDKTVKLWDVATGKERTTLQGQNGEIWSVAFSPDGTILASGSEGAVKLWDVASGKERANLNGHHWNVWRLAFSPDSKTLASADFIVPIVKLWDTTTGKERLFDTPEWLGESSADYVTYMAFTADGKTLALGIDEAIGSGTYRAARTRPLSGEVIARFSRPRIISPGVSATRSRAVSVPCCSLLTARSWPWGTMTRR